MLKINSFKAITLSFVLLLSFLDRPADPQQLRHLAAKGSERLTADRVR